MGGVGLAACQGFLVGEAYVAILVVCGSYLLWIFYPVGGVGRLACQGFLVREACVSVLVRGNGFLLSGVQWSAQ